MFNKIFKNKQKQLSFKKIFAAFIPYIHENEWIMFTSNQELVDKYSRHSAFISSFLFELKKNYSVNEISEIIKKYFILLSDEELVLFIDLYLGLSENDKKEKKFFNYVDEKFNIVDIEIDEEDLNNRFHVAAEFGSYRGLPLKSLYDGLDIESKTFLVSLLENKASFSAFKQLFEENCAINFNSLLRLLMNKGIDTSLMNTDMIAKLGFNNFKELIYTLLGNDNLEIARYVKVLVANNRFDLLKIMIASKTLSDDIFVNSYGIKDDVLLSDKDIINKFEFVKTRRYNN